MPKLRRILSDEEFERLRRKYDGQHITCPKCGKYGLLQFRQNRDRRYFYCKHGDKACYVGRIEDIEKVMEKPKERVKSEGRPGGYR